MSKTKLLTVRLDVERFTILQMAILERMRVLIDRKRYLEDEGGDTAWEINQLAHLDSLLHDINYAYGQDVRGGKGDKILSMLSRGVSDHDR